MIKDCPSVALGKERREVSSNKDNKPKLRHQVPTRVYVVTPGDRDAVAPGTKGAGVVTGIF